MRIALMILMILALMAMALVSCHPVEDVDGNGDQVVDGSGNGKFAPLILPVSPLGVFLNKSIP